MNKESKNRKVGSAAKCIYFGVATIFAMVAVAIISAVIWTDAKYGIISMDEVIFNLTMPLNGVNSGLLVSAVLTIGVPTLLAGIFVVYLSWLLASKKAKKSKIRFKAKFKIKNTKCIRFIKKHFMGICAVILVLSIVFADLSLQIHQFVSHQMQDSHFIEDNYVDPQSVSISFPKKKRNLIYIFMESMEASCSSQEEGGFFQEDHIPELTKLAKKNINFSNTEMLGGATQITGTSWTIASMISQTSGIPLKISADGNAFTDSTEVMKPITTIGDILGKQGYNQMLMVGSDATFGGRKQYFEGHGNYEVFDLFTAKEEGLLPEDYAVFWGYEDLKLFEFAKQKIAKLATEDQPFNFTMLTVDTHHPSGYLCEVCEETFEDSYSNVYRCSSRQLYEFVSWIKKQDFYKDTTIVLSGDHLSMAANYYKDLGDYERTPLNIIINPAAKVKDEAVFKNRKFSVLDMFPTTLAAMGVKVKGDKLGLGTNLFSGKPTLLERQYPDYGQTDDDTVKFVNSELSKNSKFYNSLLK